MFKNWFNKPKQQLQPESRMTPGPEINSYQMQEVFRDGSIEVPITYVERPEVEDAVKSALTYSNAIILFHGPSKSGKTVLCNKLVSDLPKVHVHVWRSMSEEEFWDQLKSALGQPDQIERLKAIDRSRGYEVSGDVKAGLNIGVQVGAKSSIGAMINETTSSGQVERTSAGSSKTAVINYLNSDPHTVIIDDFHWMDHSLYEDVFQPLKQVVANGSRIILVSVPDIDTRMKGNMSDLTGRLLKVPMPVWSAKELLEIPRSGFVALNVEPTPTTLKALLSLSFGNPLLMQGLCGELCRSQKIFATCAETKKIDLHKNDVGPLAASYAQHRTTIFDAIIDTNSPKSWKTKDGRKLSLSEVLVLAINHRRPNEKYPLSNIAKRIRERILRGDPPSNFEALVGKKIREIVEKFGGDHDSKDRSPLYFDGSTLIVLDPYFTIWARWVVGPRLAGRLFKNDDM